MWRLFVGPYWRLEKILAMLLGLCVLALALWKIAVALWPEIQFAIGAYSKYLQRCQFERKNIAIEKENAARLAILKAEDAERDRQFMALPEDERNRILAERQRFKEEQRLRTEAQRARELAEYKREQEARMKAESDARAAAEAYEKSPETKKRRAIADIIGGGYR
jgi:hypothetical protein